MNLRILDWAEADLLRGFEGLTETAAGKDGIASRLTINTIGSACLSRSVSLLRAICTKSNSNY
jgi:hypothetical protein